MSSTNVDAFVQFARDGSFEKVKQCLDAGNVHVDSRNKDGDTALMCAARNGHKGICDLLITRGCKADMQSKYGSTALMFAADNGHEGVCDLLITRGCKLDMQDKDGWTALMKAAENGHIPIMISLIEAGCNHSLKNKEGESGMDLLRENQPDKVKEVQVIRLPYSPTLLLSSSLPLH
jgi:serine/threonine-protein phosphatase 6 regulatory ankyrin repeat subunit B